MSKAHFGLIGLGVMGENLVLNAERNGFSSVVFNRTYSKTEEFLQGRGLGKNIEGAQTLQEFVNKLERPRRILMMVKAGPATDAVIDNHYIVTNSCILIKNSSFYSSPFTYS